MNSNISGDRAFWQLKIALNVAAIGCRGIEEPTLVAAYNNIIKTHAKPIKPTEKTVIADLRKETGTNGIAARDKLSTTLFHYFAQPPAQDRKSVVSGRGVEVRVAHGGRGIIKKKNKKTTEDK